MTDSTSSMPPNRKDSTLELTAVMPREKLPPISVANIAALALDPDHPETKEMEERALRDERKNRPTLVICQGCLGNGMISPARASDLKRCLAALDAVDDSDTPDDAA